MIQFVEEYMLNTHGVKVVSSVAIQRMNASLALALAGAYVEHTAPAGCITSDIARCLEHTELPAKFELIQQRSLSWVLSFAHNDMSITAACDALPTLRGE